MNCETIPDSIETLLDQLAETYARAEQLLAEYRAGLERGQFGWNVLQRMYQEVEWSAKLLAALCSASSVANDRPAGSASLLARKKQQVLQVLSRVLQSLGEAERQTKNQAAGLMPQTNGLHQAQNLYRAYATALATLTPTDSPAA